AYLRFCALACLGLSAALGQISTGTVAGSVEDQTGAVVQNAEVTLKNTATGEVRQTRTNDRGEFNVPFARVGSYSLGVSAGGFKTKALDGISLQVDQTVNLHIALELGSASETVEVTGAAPLVDSATSSLGQVIENRKILDLPLNGRNPF